MGDAHRRALRLIVPLMGRIPNVVPSLDQLAARGDLMPRKNNAGVQLRAGVQSVQQRTPRRRL
jgi:hypothetical protein